MTDKTAPPREPYVIRCPRLGHQIDLAYCRIENNGTPCFKILDCWHSHGEVMKILKAELPENAFEELLEKKPEPKMSSLLEMIAQAKKANKKES